MEHVLAGGTCVGGGHFCIRMVVWETGIRHSEDAEFGSGTSFYPLISNSTLPPISYTLIYMIRVWLGLGFGNTV